MRKLYDFIIDIWGYILGFLYWLRSLYTQYKWASLNDMGRKSWRSLSYGVGKTNATSLNRELVELDCGCSRLKHGQKLRLFRWRCDEHGLPYFDEEPDAEV